MSEIRVELFTPSRLREQAEGRALLDALGGHMPSWMPHRYGWSEPLRNVYDPAKSEHFWNTHYGLMFRNAKRSASGQVDVRTGAWDILSRITLSGRAPRAQLEGGIGPFLAQCGETLDLAYGMAHIFTEQQAADYYRLWFEIASINDDESVRSARVGPFPYCLRDLYWGNVFGPPYTELFGADRLRTAPAAVVTELRPGYFYLQVTDSILDLWDAATVPAYEAARDAVKQHLGPECFYDPAATTPRRAPAFRNSAEEGLWKPREGDRLGPGVKELLARIAEQAQQGDVVSTDLRLITRRRPDALAFARLLSEAAGAPVDIAGDFTDPNDYLNITTADGMWIEMEPPGHVEYQDLREMFPEDVTLPDPDDEGCLWFAFASVPAGIPRLGLTVIERTFRQLARDYDGIATDPG